MLDLLIPVRKAKALRSNFKLMTFFNTVISHEFDHHIKFS